MAPLIQATRNPRKKVQVTSSCLAVPRKLDLKIANRIPARVRKLAQAGKLLWRSVLLELSKRSRLVIGALCPRLFLYASYFTLDADAITPGEHYRRPT